MGTTALSALPYPEPTDEPYVHLDLKRLAEAVDEELPVESTTQPAHKQGRVWVNGGLVMVSDGTTWQPAGRWIMGEVTAQEAGPLGTAAGAAVLSRSITTVAGPATVSYRGFLSNANSGADRTVDLLLAINGTALGLGARHLVPYEAGQSSRGVAVGFDVPITAPAGPRTYALLGSASAASAVFLRHGRLWVEQGGRAAGA